MPFKLKAEIWGECKENMQGWMSTLAKSKIFFLYFAFLGLCMCVVSTWGSSFEAVKHILSFGKITFLLTLCFLSMLLMFLLSRGFTLKTLKKKLPAVKVCSQCLKWAIDGLIIGCVSVQGFRMVLKVWFLDQQHQQLPGTCYKCKFSDFAWDLMSQKF